MAKWVTLGIQLGYRDDQLRGFVKEKQKLERERRETPKHPREAEAQCEITARKAEAQRKREAREAKAHVREKPGKLKEHTGKPIEQPKMKESMKNGNYKIDWFVYEENRN